MKKRFLAAGALLAAVAAIGASPAAAASIDCAQAPGNVVSGAVAGSVHVGPGVSCVVANAHVSGSVTVQGGGSLLMIGSQVDRSVQATGAAWLVIAGQNTIGGSLQVVGTTGVPPAMSANTVCTTTVASSLMLTGNTGAFDVGCGAGLGNTFRSALMTGNPGGVTFQHNVVTASGICTGFPAVTGGGNTIGRNIGCP